MGRRSWWNVTRHPPSRLSFTDELSSRTKILERPAGPSPEAGDRLIYLAFAHLP
jgi:hypothetical protein